MTEATKKIMNKSKILDQLNAMAAYRLFGERAWVSDPESFIAMDLMFLRLGLQEPVPGCSDTSRSTALGMELDLELIMAFVRSWADEEIPNVLLSYGFIDEIELDRIFELLEAGAHPEDVLLPLVRWAYIRHFGPQACARALPVAVNAGRLPTKNIDLGI